MILIPWYIRLSIDTLMFSAPFLFVCHNPLLIWEFAEKKNRILRKRDFEDVTLIENPFKSVNEVKKLYRELGYDEDF